MKSWFPVIVSLPVQPAGAGRGFLFGARSYLRGSRTTRDCVAAFLLEQLRCWFFDEKEEKIQLKTRKMDALA